VFASKVPRGGTENEEVMPHILAIAMIPSVVSAADTKAKEKQEDCLQNAGTVMGEILSVPDDIPQALLNKAKCVLVLPPVVKAAFIFGGSYGRGAMVCRSGKDFTGTWGAPGMYVLARRWQLWLSDRWRGYRFRNADHE
jgi:lipid-binding SYLF domain-containing protein